MELFHADLDSEDEEFCMNLVQRLPVSTFLEYDPDVPPQNGADYLRRVQLEAQKELQITVASNVCPNPSKFFDVDRLEEKEFIKSLPEFLINEEYTVPQIIGSFEKLRQHIEELRLKNEEKPFRKSKEWWREYCFVQNVNNVGQGPQFKDYQVQNNYQTKNLPNLFLLSRLTQKEVNRLLNYQYEWMIENNANDDKDDQFLIERTLWIYSLLATLDTIQTDDMHNLLRQISRFCSQIRHRLELKKRLENHRDDNLTDYTLNDLNPNNNEETNQLDQQCHEIKTSNQKTATKILEKLSSLNLIILLVGHYFKQKDLLDTW